MSLVDSTTGEIVGRSLDELEAVIATGLNTFVQVGTALAEVRDSKLYAASFPSFETYCQERWGLSRSRAYQMMDAAELSTIVDTELDSESQARALAPLKDDPDAANEALNTAIAEAEAEGAKLTAKRIKDAVERQLNPSTSDDGGVSVSESSEPATPADSSPAPSSDHLEEPAGDSLTGEDAGTANDPSSPQNDPEDELLATLARLKKSISQSHSLFSWKPEDIHDLNDPDCARGIRDLMAVISPWWETYKASEPKGLRVINGGVE